MRAGKSQSLGIDNRGVENDSAHVRIHRQG